MTKRKFRVVVEFSTDPNFDLTPFAFDDYKDAIAHAYGISCLPNFPGLRIKGGELDNEIMDRNYLKAVAMLLGLEIDVD
jgi:hypothetical protein